MSDKKYYFHPEKKILKQGYLMEDDNQKVIYEAKCLKAPLIGAATFEFVNHLTGRSEEHKVGSVPANQVGPGLLDLVSAARSGSDLFSLRQGFKFDGNDIWAHLSDLGVKVDVTMSLKDPSYTITQNGQEIAVLHNELPGGKKSFMSGPGNFAVETSDDYLDIAFLVAFAIAKVDKAAQSQEHNN